MPMGRYADNPKTPLEVTDILMCMNLCQKAATMFHAVGLDFQADIVDNLFFRLRAAAREYLIEANAQRCAGAREQAGFSAFVTACSIRRKSMPHLTCCLNLFIKMTTRWTSAGSAFERCSMCLPNSVRPNWHTS